MLKRKMSAVLLAASCAIPVGAVVTTSVAPVASANTCDTIPLPKGQFYATYSHNGAGGGVDNANVAKIQRVVNRAVGAGLVVDGVYGYATKQAVAKFQRYLNSTEGAGLTVDGVYGAATWYQAWSAGFGGYQC